MDDDKVLDAMERSAKHRYMRAWGHRCDVCGRRVLRRGIVMVSLETENNVVRGLPRETAVHLKCLRPIHNYDVDERTGAITIDEPLRDALRKR